MKNKKISLYDSILIDDEDEAKLLFANFQWDSKKEVLFIVRNGKFRSLARFLLNYSGAETIDHEDRNNKNFQKQNLRITSVENNCRNQDVRENNTSGFKGVSWDKEKKKWRAMIRVKGLKKHLCYSSTAKLTAIEYDRAAEKYHGEFAVLNFKKEP